VADEPTIGEVARLIGEFRKDFAQFRREVLTVEVWKAERELMELRIRENEKDITDLASDLKAERDKRAQEKHEADNRAATNRRQALFAVLTALVFPILVAIVLAAFLKG
jgi:hypothetical protein